VLREYGWPFQPPAPDRAHREAAVLALLDQEAVPAPRVLAVTDEALLMTFEQGQLLGKLAEEAATELDGAWRDTGRALRRVHQIVPPVDLNLAGGPGRSPLPWHERVLADVDAHLTAALKTRPDVAIHASRIRGVFDEAVDRLAVRPMRLLHGDAQPWNVLVERADKRWSCTAILDWEFAELGDPVWDLVRFDQLRRRPLAPTPDSFFEGYGERGPATIWRLYELALHLWQADDADTWPDPLPSHKIADEYLTRLPAHLDEIERLLS